MLGGIGTLSGTMHSEAQRGDAHGHSWEAIKSKKGDPKDMEEKRRKTTPSFTSVTQSATQARLKIWTNLEFRKRLNDNS